jgi:hypothetical protein
MTQYLSGDAALRKHEDRSIAVWLFILAAAIIAVGATLSDASLTPDQRIQAYLQSGVFP